MVEALDLLGQRLVFMDCAGQILFATAATRRLLKGQVGFVSDLEELNSEIRQHLRRPEPAIPSTVAVKEVVRDEQLWRINGFYLEAGLLGSASVVLCSLDPQPTNPLAVDVLRDRFGLSNQESRVARLLALGLPNTEVAKELKISPHTARHHTQRVLDKLGARSRTSLVSMLLRWG